MAVYKRGGTWWYAFTFCGKRIQESANTSRKTIATNAEKNRRLDLERAINALPTENRAQRIDSVSERTAAYLAAYKVSHRPKSIAFCTGCLNNIDNHLGTLLLCDLNQERIIDYIRTRQKEKAAGRTINAELGELSRALGSTWKTLWPKVRKLEERTDTGVAISADQQKALLVAAEQAARGELKLKVKRAGAEHEQRIGPRGVMMPTMIRLALLTGMRSGELCNLRWSQVDTTTGFITVGAAKTKAGEGRTLAMNQQIRFILEAHRLWWYSKFGEPQPDLYLFPFGSPQPCDPTRPVTTLKHTWETIRAAAKVDCRWHDLRHTFCSTMAERGVADATMLAMMGHMSRAMLEKYSHISQAAKVKAMEGVTLPEVTAADLASNGVSTKSTTVTNTAAIQ